MKVKELKAWLNQFQDEEEIVITAMDDYFSCQDFSLHSPYDNGQAQEIILPYYFERYLKEVADES